MLFMEKEYKTFLTLFLNDQKDSARWGGLLS